MVAQEHNLYIPTDNNTGKLTGTRIHTPFLFTKEIDSSSPYLYKAVTTGQTLNPPSLSGTESTMPARKWSISIPNLRTSRW
ncbi:type VI secretion system effector [Klebsiella pneumoniae]|uniref:Type VI secretion system effector n=1 Tax=Klebsiella pneumoniae TaxID=573 RepID=A0A378F1K5_KLEPN|nr:type VI secretion system effector [Klebsiella pneumoniae]